jgi:hypothetical protein
MPVGLVASKFLVQLKFAHKSKQKQQIVKEILPLLFNYLLPEFCRNCVAEQSRLLPGMADAEM